MVTWLLHDAITECPQGWQRFVADLCGRRPFDSIEGFSIETLNTELAQFNAQLYDSGNNSFVHFADERRYNLFILKYGGR